MRLGAIDGRAIVAVTDEEAGAGRTPKSVPDAAGDVRTVPRRASQTEPSQVLGVGFVLGLAVDALDDRGRPQLSQTRIQGPAEPAEIGVRRVAERQHCVAEVGEVRQV